MEKKDYLCNRLATAIIQASFLLSGIDLVHIIEFALPRAGDALTEFMPSPLLDFSPNICYTVRNKEARALSCNYSPSFDKEDNMQYLFNFNLTTINNQGVIVLEKP